MNREPIRLTRKIIYAADVIDAAYEAGLDIIRLVDPMAGIEEAVVRCGQCRYFSESIGKCIKPEGMWRAVEPNEFCSKGAPRED